MEFQNNIEPTVEEADKTKSKSKVILRGSIVPVAHDLIDRQKWDDCVDQSPNGTVCLYSWFLDLLCPQWSALVLGDYVLVMPLPIRSKYGFQVLLQPLFIQQLGVFGAGTVHHDIIRRFIRKIPSNIRLIDYHFNHLNSFPDCRSVQHYPNLVLSLNKTYTDLHEAYSVNLRRKLRKANKSNLVMYMDGDSHQVISLFRRYNKKVLGTISEKWYRNLQRVIDESQSRGMAEIWTVKDAGDQLLAGIVLLHSPKHKRMILNLIAQSDTGRNVHAGAWLIDQYIQEYAGEELIFDFEGSKDRGVARYYNSFGAAPEYYPRYHKALFPLSILTLFHFR